MKIFNWVHRRFNHKDGMAAQNEMRKTTVSAEDQKQCMFDAWKGGILTIGTFGYDPLPQNGVVKGIMEPVDENSIATHKQVEDESEEEAEVNPLMMYAAACDYSTFMGMEETSTGLTSMKPDPAFEVIKKERRTLAELFSSEWEDEDDNDDDDDDDGMKKAPIKTTMAVKQQTAHKAAAAGRRIMPLTKKIIGEDGHRPAIHKLNRLVRRMLNRKIHPDEVVFAAAHNPNPNSTATSTHHDAATLLYS